MQTRVDLQVKRPRGCDKILVRNRTGWDEREGRARKKEDGQDRLEWLEERVRYRWMGIGSVGAQGWRVLALEANDLVHAP